MDRISDMNFGNVEQYYNQGLQEITELPDRVNSFEESLNTKSSLQKFYIGSKPPEAESLENNTILVWFQLSDN